MNQVLLFKPENFQDPSEENQRNLFSNRIENCGTIEKLNSLLFDLNRELKNGSLSLESKIHLKRLRQRIYSKKKAFKMVHNTNHVQNAQNTSTPTEVHCINTAKLLFEYQNLPNSICSEKSSNDAHEIRINNPVQVSENLLSKKLLQSSVALFLATVSGGLLWSQSIELYNSSGFSNPQLIALGGIAMAIGFALLHSIKKSWITFFLCIYISFYEVFFIATGTQTDEKKQKAAEAEEMLGMDWKKQNVAKLKADYESLKNRYENAESKVFKNSWFKKTFIEPAWEQYSKAQSQLVGSRTIVQNNSEMDEKGWLKILYRLGLVGLLMVAIHTLQMEKWCN